MEYANYVVCVNVFYMCSLSFCGFVYADARRTEEAQKTKPGVGPEYFGG